MEGDAATEEAKALQCAQPGYGYHGNRISSSTIYNGVLTDLISMEGDRDCSRLDQRPHSGKAAQTV